MKLKDFIAAQQPEGHMVPWDQVVKIVRGGWLGFCQHRSTTHRIWGVKAKESLYLIKGETWVFFTHKLAEKEVVFVPHLVRDDKHWQEGDATEAFLLEKLGVTAKVVALPEPIVMIKVQCDPDQNEGHDTVLVYEFASKASDHPAF